MDSFNQIIYWLLANSLGGQNRIKILNSLFKKPQNAHELSINLDIEYKTIRYHLKVLHNNNFIEIGGYGYGKTYFISDKLMQHKEYFDKLCKDIDK
ncbi:MAG: winged helix-turn-helix domain-containing protein [Candidatus Thermoplasmatota archaeon]|nr:winged helix-turn-helix domain-containing protein [Candidatus Thermoplasmatota archaeon]